MLELTPMRHDEVNRVLAAEGVSNFGSMLSRLAIPWLAALTLQATPFQMAALLVADVAAAAFASLSAVMMYGVSSLRGSVCARRMSSMVIFGFARRMLLMRIARHGLGQSLP